MNGKWHKIVGCTSMIAIAMTNFPTIQIDKMTMYPLGGLALVYMGSTIPDADIPNSEWGHKLPFVSKFCKHRGMTHTMLVVVLMGMLLKSSGYSANAAITLIQSIAFGFIVGYVSHIYMDIHNGTGTALLFPLVRRKIHIMDIDLGAQEVIFCTLFCAGVFGHLICASYKIMLI